MPPLLPPVDCCWTDNHDRICRSRLLQYDQILSKYDMGDLEGFPLPLLLGLSPACFGALQNSY